MNNLLYDINAQIAQLTESLSEGEIDQQTYLDTIEAMGAEEAVEQIVRSIMNLEAEAEAVRIEKMSLDGKQKHLEQAADNLRKILTLHMELVNQPQLQAGIFSVTKGSTQSVELLYEDVTNYPADYLISQKPKLDKRKLLKDLKDGKMVDGAVLKQTDYIKIK